MPGKRQQVSVLKLTRRGVVRWLVNRIENGKRRRTIFTTRAEADAEASRLRAQLESSGQIWVSLPASTRDQLVRFHQACATRRIDFWELLRAYDARRLEAHADSPSLKSVIDELISTKRSAGRSPRYTDSLELVLESFAKGRESLPIASIELADVELWLEGKNTAGRSTYKSRLSTLFSFGVRRRYRRDNPCDGIEAPSVRPFSPAIFTVRQTAVCLATLRRRYPRGLAWFVLSTLCGLRPEEAERTTWDAIELKSDPPHVRVEAQTSKIRQRRIVTPLPMAITWLNIAQDLGSELPLTRQVRRRTLRRLRDALGWQAWPKDVTRHTAASYWLAVEESPTNVAEQLGHSVAQLKTHYRALVTRSDAQRFWKLVPARFRRPPVKTPPANEKPASATARDHSKAG